MLPKLQIRRAREQSSPGFLVCRTCDGIFPAAEISPRLPTPYCFPCAAKNKKRNTRNSKRGLVRPRVQQALHRRGESKCSLCNEIKSFAHFNTWSCRGKPRPQSYCRQCANEYNATYNRARAAGEIIPRTAMRDHRLFRRDLYESNRGLCIYCGDQLESGWQVDHATPISRGGGLGWDNCVPSCRRCNQLKGQFTAWEFYDSGILFNIGALPAF